MAFNEAMLFYGYAARHEAAQSFLKRMDEAHDREKYDGHVQMDVCGTSDEPHYVLIVGSSKKRIEGSELKAIPDIEISPTWDRMLRSYLLKVGLTIPNERPRWWLTAYRGEGD